jgi:hypothetical protein
MFPKARYPSLPKNEAHRTISPGEAARAIYIDFESTAADPPVLLGAACEDELVQWVLDPRLGDAAAASGLEQLSLADAVQRVLDRCVREERLLVGYSQHERQVIHGELGIDVSDLYRDARMIAVRWKNRTRLALQRDDHELKTFLEAIGYPRRAYLGAHHSAKWIREVTTMLDRKSTFAELTAVKKSFWTKLLEHNAVDCDGMRELTIRAAAGLEG